MRNEGQFLVLPSFDDWFEIKFGKRMRFNSSFLIFLIPSGLSISGSGLSALAAAGIIR
jgi:hypothetical protein